MSSTSSKIASKIKKRKSSSATLKELTKIHIQVPVGGYYSPDPEKEKLLKLSNVELKLYEEFLLERIDDWQKEVQETQGQLENYDYGSHTSLFRESLKFNKRTLNNYKRDHKKLKKWLRFKSGEVSKYSDFEWSDLIPKDSSELLVAFKLLLIPLVILGFIIGVIITALEEPQCENWTEGGTKKNPTMYCYDKNGNLIYRDKSFFDEDTIDPIWKDPAWDE